MKKDTAKVQRLLKPKHMESPTARVIRVRYIAVPNASDAKERLSRAVAILLKSGMRKKKNERRQHKKKTRQAQSHT